MFTQTLENHQAGPVSEALEPPPPLLLPGKSPVCLWKVCAQPRRFSGWVKGALRVWSWETRASPLRSHLLTAQVGGEKVSNLWPRSPHYKTNGMDLTGCAPPGPGTRHSKGTGLCYSESRPFHTSNHLLRLTATVLGGNRGSHIFR